VDLRDLKMSEVVVTFKIMPESPETNMQDLQKKCEEIISKSGEVGKVEIKPIAFGLKSLHLYVIMDESKGSPDDIEKELADLPETNSAEVIDVRRTVDV
jgi:elongation factor 1-beta